MAATRSTRTPRSSPTASPPDPTTVVVQAPRTATRSRYGAGAPTRPTKLGPRWSSAPEPPPEVRLAGRVPLTPQLRLAGRVPLTPQLRLAGRVPPSASEAVYRDHSRRGAPGLDTALARLLDHRGAGLTGRVPPSASEAVYRDHSRRGAPDLDTALTRLLDHRGVGFAGRVPPSASEAVYRDHSRRGAPGHQVSIRRWRAYSTNEKGAKGGVLSSRLRASRPARSAAAGA